MALPKYKEIEIPLLKELAARGGEARAQEIVEALVKHFPDITSDDLKLKCKGGEQKWHNYVWWARQRLKENGDLESSAKSVWRITDKGRARIGVQPVPATTLPFPPPLPSIHADLVKKIEEIGRRVGFLVDIKQSNVPYRHDCLWHTSSYRPPQLVWEVCDKGQVDKDMNSLQWSVDRRKWGAKGVLVVIDEADYNKANNVLGPRQDIIVVKAEWVRQLDGALIEPANVALLRALFWALLTEGNV